MCLAVPMEVKSVAGDEAVVELEGVGRRVSLLACDEPPQVGDFVIVHAGFAIHRIDPEAARESLALLDELAFAAGEP